MYEQHPYRLAEVLLGRTKLLSELRSFSQSHQAPYRAPRLGNPPQSAFNTDSRQRRSGQASFNFAFKRRNLPMTKPTVVHLKHEARITQRD